MVVVALKCKLCNLHTSWNCAVFLVAVMSRKVCPTLQLMKKGDLRETVVDPISGVLALALAMRRTG